MKKILITLLLTFAMLYTAVFAAQGDVCGTIYSTDIRTCINGVWVDSYNIGGRTVVVIEDITEQYEYSDELRTLILSELNPQFLRSSEKNSDIDLGVPVGSIFETDIRTFFRGRELQGYSLNGKMAVVVEELGGDGEFSDIGGSYSWNESDRTLILESAYRYPYEIRTLLEDRHYNMILTENNGVFEASFEAAPLCGGEILYNTEIRDNSMVNVQYEGENIGYICRFAEGRILSDENQKQFFVAGAWQAPTDYFLTDKLKSIIHSQPHVAITYIDWQNYFENQTLATINDSFETDEYVFLYITFAHTHGGTDALIKLSKTDNYRLDFDDDFESVSLYGQKAFENVTIDREAEKVFIHYDIDYEIDLKTNRIVPLSEGGTLFLE